MTRYKWKSRNRLGEKTSGIIEAHSLLLAKITLRKQGIIAQKIIKQREHLAVFNLHSIHLNIKPIDIHLFMRHIATLNKAGIPLIQSLTILENGTNKYRLKTLIKSIRSDVESGLMLAESLNRYPIFFNALICSMIHAGEQSGTLDSMLEKIVLHQERIVRVKHNVRKALAYPFAVMFIAIFVTSGLLIFVIPQFESLFAGLGAELPAFTRIVISISKFFSTYWLILVSIVYALFNGFRYAYKHISAFTDYVQSSILKLPVIGGLLQKASIARFSRTLSITFAAGMPLTEALNCVAGNAGNRLYANAIFNIQKEISTGQSMQHAMQKTQLFSKFVVTMVAIGEESGTLERMLNKVADFYEEDMDNTIALLNSLLEPVIMAVLGILVGGLVVAMYLPILKFGTGV